MFYDFFSRKVFSVVLYCTVVKIVLHSRQSQNVKFLSQVDKMLTVNNTHEKKKNVKVCCMTFGRRDDDMAKLCT